MRVTLCLVSALIVAGAPVLAAEDPGPARERAGEPPSAGGAKAAPKPVGGQPEDIKDAIRRVAEQRRRSDERNRNLWARWTFAVCIGCGEAQAPRRIVYTNPINVLAGIPAAVDDAKQARRHRRAARPRRSAVVMAMLGTERRARQAVFAG